MNIHQQRGFTLIELVAVIVLLGILAVTALPRFINLSEDAYAATNKATFGAFSSGVSMVEMKARAAGTSSSGRLTVGGTTIKLYQY